MPTRKKETKKTATKKPAKKAPKKPARKTATKKPAKKPAKKTAKPVQPVVLPKPVIVREPKFRCEVCHNLTKDSKLHPLVWSYTDQKDRCPNCRVFWYAVAINTDANPETVAKEMTRRAKIDGIADLKQVLVPRHRVPEITKTTWHVWRDQNAVDNAWRIPEEEKDPAVLAEFGLLGIITAESHEEARDYARHKWPNEFNRVVTFYKEGGKPRMIARPKFRGYIIVQCEYTPAVHDLIHSTRDSFGTLPLKASLKGFRHPKKQPRQNIPPKQWEIEQHEKWCPSAMNTEQEVIKLLEEKQLLKTTPSTLTLKHPIGSRVRILNGQWKDTVGVVHTISDETPIKYVVDLELFGRKFPSKFEAWQLVAE